MRRPAAAIGIDIGGTNLRAARVSETGAILDYVTERISRDSIAVVVARIVDLVRRLDRADVAAVGIGIPGRVDAAHRLVLSGGYVNMSSALLAESVEQATRKQVIIDNDCNMALIAEITLGAARGQENVVMFTIGTGIGGAVLQEGHIVRGRMSAGQLGHLTVDVNGTACACGRSGCVETTSSGTALNRHIAAAGLPAGTTLDQLFARDFEGDAAARVLDAWAKPLRAAIDSAVAVFDPALVLLGGGLGQGAARAIARAPAFSPWYQCPISAAQLGDDAGVIGGALSALSRQRTGAVVRWTPAAPTSA
jgi:glucokinase